MKSNQNDFEVNYLIINGKKKQTLEINDTTDKKKITLDIVIKEEE